MGNKKSQEDMVKEAVEEAKKSPKLKTKKLQMSRTRRQRQKKLLKKLRKRRRSQRQRKIQKRKAKNYLARKKIKKTRRLKNLQISLPVRWQSLITSANVQKEKISDV